MSALVSTRRYGVNKLLFAVLALAAATTPVVFRDPGQRFTLVLPPGWSVGSTDSESESSTLKGDGQTVTVVFYESVPGKWTVDSLMAAGEAGLKQVFADAVLLKAEDVAASGSPGRFAVYGRAPGARDYPRMFLSCVILHHGGVQLSGVLSKAGSEERIRSMLESVRSAEPK